MTTSTPTPEPRRADASALAILAGNLFTIGLALWQGWDLGPLLWVYWCQSVTIGFFNFLRMMKLQDFTTEGLTSNGRPVPETPAGKRSTAIFFLFHYGFFHLAYLVFIAAHGSGFDPGDWLWVAAGALGFLASHSFSFRYNVAKDLEGRPNLGAMMFIPYCRIVPMHLTIIFGGAMAKSQLALLFFLVLKSAADQLMHHVEHAMMRKSLRAGR